MTGRKPRFSELVFLLLSALYEARSLRDHHSLALRPYLERVAVDKTVILTQASCPYLDFAENWILHVEHLGVTNWLTIVDDETAFNYLDELFPGHIVHPSVVTKRPRHAAKAYMHYGSADFNEMMCERLRIQEQVLEMGFSFMWTDMDSVWLVDALKLIPRGLDFVGTSDRSKFGHDEVEELKLCGCTTFWSPSLAARHTLLRWHDVCVNSPDDDQVALQKMWTSGVFRENITWYIMPWQLFPSGALLDRLRIDYEFARDPNDPSLIPAVVHANYRSGRADKHKFLKRHMAWKISPEQKYPQCEEQVQSI